MITSHSDYIRQAREKYSRIRSIQCPSFPVERINFTNKGFLHLIRKGRKLRSQSDQVRRLKLLPFIVPILENSTAIYKYEKNIIGSSVAHFWTIRGKINSIKIRIIIRKINSEPLHFFSVMDE
jgi:hypothetical protein